MTCPIDAKKPAIVTREKGSNWQDDSVDGTETIKVPRKEGGNREENDM